MKKLKHLGVDSFFAERKQMLDDYDNAKKKSSEHHVQVNHGFIAEKLIRSWLISFLPKKFGVCKGYIITYNPEYEGKLEEWDIIIYDALEAPILFTNQKDNNYNSLPIRAIPVEYVRGIIEVKATLTATSVELAVKKLLKLKQFIGINEYPKYPKYLCNPFISSVIFFETKVNNLNEYRKTLDNFTPIYTDTPLVPFMGGLVLRSQKQNNHSGYLELYVCEKPLFENDTFEMSNNFNLPSGKFGSFGCSGWGVNDYPAFVFDLLACIRGNIDNSVSSFYGKNYEEPQGSRLFSN